jgi:hypothetical protein
MGGPSKAPALTAMFALGLASCAHLGDLNEKRRAEQHTPTVCYKQVEVPCADGAPAPPTKPEPTPTQNNTLILICQNGRNSVETVLKGQDIKVKAPQCGTETWKDYRKSNPFGQRKATPTRQSTLTAICNDQEATVKTKKQRVSSVTCNKRGLKVEQQPTIHTVSPQEIAFEIGSDEVGARQKTLLKGRAAGPNVTVRLVRSATDQLGPFRLQRAAGGRPTNYTNPAPENTDIDYQKAQALGR